MKGAITIPNAIFRTQRKTSPPRFFIKPSNAASELIRSGTTTSKTGKANSIPPKIFLNLAVSFVTPEKRSFTAPTMWSKMGTKTVYTAIKGSLRSPRCFAPTVNMRKQEASEKQSNKPQQKTRRLFVCEFSVLHYH